VGQNASQRVRLASAAREVGRGGEEGREEASGDVKIASPQRIPGRAVEAEQVLQQLEEGNPEEQPECRDDQAPALLTAGQLPGVADCSALY